MSDFWNECFEPQHGVPPKNFEQTFCRVCLNPECVRSAASGTRWVRRMATQAERLLENPQFADPNDPKYRDLRSIDFPSALREAMRLEIATRRGDWSVPTSEDAQQLAAELAARTAPPLAPPEPEPAPPVVGDEPVGQVLQSYEIRGSTGDVYKVQLVEKVVGLPTWTCTCKAFEFGRARPCKHIEYAQSLSAPDPVPTKPETPAPQPAPPKSEQVQAPTGSNPSPSRFQGQAQPPPTSPPSRRQFLPPMGNIPLPSEGVMVDGSTPPKPAERPDVRAKPTTATPPPEVDPWAAPVPPKKPSNVVPVGGRVVLGGKPGEKK